MAHDGRGAGRLDGHRHGAGRAVRASRALLYDYFKQLFAQVTNPPLDAIREELVTSMGSTIGPERNLLKPEPESCRQIAIKYPIIHNEHVAKLRHLAPNSPFRSTTLSMLFDPEKDGPALEQAMDELCTQASEAVADGLQHPDPLGPRRRPAPGADPEPAGDGRRAPSPRARGHAHAVRARRRVRRRARSAPRVAAARLRRGRGEPVRRVRDDRRHDPPGHADRASTATRRVGNYIKALNKGVLKVMSKMGISTLQSYCGAQIFEAIGLKQAFIDKYFTHTTSRIGGVGIDVIAEEVRAASRARVRGASRSSAGARGGRRVPVAPRRRVPPVQPGDGVQAAARDAQRAVHDLQGIHPRRRTRRTSTARRCAVCSV